MRRLLGLGVVCGVLALSCTAVVAGALSGYQGSGPAQGGCFKLKDNPCSECIANNCENPSGSPPASLAKVCEFDTAGMYSIQQCAGDPSLANWYCNNLFADGGTYATAIDTQGAAENNLSLCVRDQCKLYCSNCEVDVPGCTQETTPLPEAGVCGACLAGAMNTPGGSCQSYVMQGSTCGDYTGGTLNAITSCAMLQCHPVDCSGLSAPPDGGISSEAYALRQCLWQQCSSSCPQN